MNEYAKMKIDEIIKHNHNIKEGSFVYCKANKFFINEATFTPFMIFMEYPTQDIFLVNIEDAEDDRAKNGQQSVSETILRHGSSIEKDMISDFNDIEWEVCGGVNDSERMNNQIKKR